MKKRNNQSSIYYDDSINNMRLDACLLLRKAMNDYLYAQHLEKEKQHANQNNQ